MTVYVDTLLEWGWVLYGRKVASCHMIADTLDELHEMAERIGMKRSWFQDHTRMPHYDLTKSRRDAAIALGAQEISCKDAVRKMRAIRAAKT